MKNRKRTYGTVIPKKKSFFKFFLINLVFLIISLAIVFSLRAAMRWDKLIVQNIKVTGNLTAAKTSVILNTYLDLVSRDKWRSWFGPYNILSWLYADSVSLSKYVPAIASSSLSVDLRKRIITIDISEKKLWGIWCVKNHSCFGINETGVAFVPTPEPIGFLIKKITDENDERPHLGKHMIKNNEWLNYLVSVTDKIKAAGLYPKEIVIKDKSLSEWSLVTHLGPVLLFSFTNQPPHIAEVLTALKKETRLSSLKTIDFRIPDKVYYENKL